MAFWDDKERITVGASVTPLFETIDKRNWKMDAIIDAVLNNKDIAKAILDAAIAKKNSYKMDKFYEKGAEWGYLPTVSTTNYTIGDNYWRPQYSTMHRKQIILQPDTPEYDAFVRDVYDSLDDDETWYPPQGEDLELLPIITSEVIGRQYTDRGAEYQPYPIVMIRQDRGMSNLSKKTKEGKRRRKMFGYCGLDAKGMQEALAENPDVDKVDDAALLCRMPLSTNTQLGLKALYYYFYRLGENLSWDDNPGMRWLNYTTSEYHTTMSIESISISVVDKVIGDLYTVSKTMEIQENTWSVTTNVGSENHEQTRSYSEPVPIFTFYKQVSATQCERIYIYGIDFNTMVEGRMATLDWYTEYVDGTEEAPFYVILDATTLDAKEYDGSELFNKLETTYLVNQALSLAINSYVVTVVKWYQTGWFKFVMIIVGAILSYFTGGAAGVAVYALLTILTLAFGEKIGIIGAVLMTILTLGATIGNLITNIVTMTVSQVMSATMSILSSIITLIGKGYDYYLAGEMEDLIQEGEDWAGEMTAADKVLSEALDLLGAPRVPFNHIGSPYFDPAETPDMFMHRTLDMDVIDTLYAVHEQFIEASLVLPTISDSMKYQTA